MNRFDQSIIEPGDSLLYYGESGPNHFGKQHAGIVDWMIAVKTSYWIAHIEIYTGSGMSVASRNGIGVNRYPLRLGGLMAVRRPRQGIDLFSAEKWFVGSARGQGYDFKGLLCFYLAVKRGSPTKMFCSEFALRWYRHAGFQPFNPDVDADRTGPCEFWKTGMMSTVWQKHQP